MESVPALLTPSEQRLLALLPRWAGFSLSAATRVLGGRFPRKYLSELLSRIAAKGRLARLKNGFYYAGATSSLKGVFSAVEALHPGAYAAFSTALYLHGVVDQRPAELVFATESSYGKMNVGGMPLRLVALHDGFYGTEEVNGVRVSTLAKTFYDSLSRPKWAGGFDAAIKLLAHARLSRKQYFELAGYLEDTGRRLLASRMIRRGRGRLPAFFVKRLTGIAGMGGLS